MDHRQEVCKYHSDAYGCVVEIRSLLLTRIRQSLGKNSVMHLNHFCSGP